MYDVHAFTHKTWCFHNNYANNGYSSTARHRFERYKNIILLRSNTKADRMAYNLFPIYGHAPISPDSPGGLWQRAGGGGYSRADSAGVSPVNTRQNKKPRLKKSRKNKKAKSIL
nr:MAG TPA: hypothetical protein [Caudoviricetes sp.]